VDTRRETGAASEVVAACEKAWSAFQRHHDALPNAVIILGSGVDRGRLIKLGHWWGARWEAAGELRGEVLLAGEALHLPVEDVFEVLLHEAAHGLNAARGIKDTSRGGRYHNARYRATALEVGLDVEQVHPYGWAKTTLAPAAAERYASEIATLRDAVQIARRLDSRTAAGAAGRDRTGQGPSAGDRVKTPPLLCGCGRRVRMAPSVAARGPVLCGSCGSEFTASKGVDRTATHPSAGGVAHLRAVGAQRSEPDPDATQSATRVIRRAMEGDGGLTLVRKVAAWAEQHGELLDEAFAATDAAEAVELNKLARAFRRIDGHLDGSDVTAGNLQLALGEQVVVQTETEASDGSAQLLPDVGVLGQIVAVNSTGGSITVDFPIAGRFRLTTEEAGRFLAYGYALPLELDPLPTGREPISLVRPASETLAEVVEMELL
jgi:hypothetical protein